MTHTTEGIAAAAEPTGFLAVAADRSPGILVVDDNEAVRAFLGFGLEASGFAVWLATDGREGLAICRDHGPAIDMLLLDVRMPGWDGPETLTAIRALAPDIPCCFMSGDTGHYTDDDLLGLGAIAVLQKPFLLGELVAQLRRMAAPIERRDASRPARWHDDCDQDSTTTPECYEHRSHLDVRPARTHGGTMQPLSSPTQPKVERGDNLTIITFTADAIRNVESVIGRELEALTPQAGPQHLLLDFTHVKYLNSIELGTLISLRKRVEATGGRVTLFNLSTELFKIFTITRLHTLLDICREAGIERPDSIPNAPEATKTRQ